MQVKVSIVYIFLDELNAIDSMLLIMVTQGLALVI